MIIDTDSHTHPFQGARDHDGMRKYAEAAVKAGLRKVVFTEHAPVDPCFHFDSRHYLNREEYETYLECAERCRAEFAGVLEIGIGVEADYHPRNLEQVARLKRDYPLEYVGGSLHLLAKFWKDETADLIDDAYFVYALDRTLELVESGLYSTLNHLDFFRWKRDGFDPRRHEERIRGIFGAMVKHDVALELNTSGIRKPFASFLPCPEVWQLSLEYPLRRVYGSDAHQPEFVGSDIAAAQKLFA